MTILIVTMHVIVSVFLIAVILLQAGRGQGLSWGVFGGNPQSILGTKSASFLKRVTTGCAVIFLFTCISLNIIETKKARSLILPQQPISQLDFSKIKEALKEAEKAAAKNGTAPATATTVAVTNEVQQAVAQTEPTQTVPETPQENSPLATQALPSPDKQ